MKVCSVESCGKPIDSHGFCSAHAARFRRHGDPLAGRVSPGEPMNYLQSKVLSARTDKCLIWPFNKSRGGYAVIRMGDKTVNVSRYVCEKANGPGGALEAAHSCGNGHLGCVNPRHVRWTDHKSNCADKNIHGTAQKGTMNPASILSEDAAREIMAMKGKASARSIGLIFGISRETVSHIHNGRKWAHLF